MSIYLSSYHVLVALSAAVSCGIALTAWRNRDIPGARWLAVLMVAVTIWGLAKLLEMYSSGLSTTLFWVNVQYAGIVVVPVGWLAFAFEYTGRDGRVNGRTLASLLVVPVLVTVLLWTNETHGLFRTVDGIRRYGTFSVLHATAGPAFWVHIGYSYLLLVIGSWVIVQLTLLSNRQYYGQAIGLLVAVLVPWIGNAIYVTELAPAGFDPTIMAFTLTGLMLLVIVARHRFLALVPAAKEVARDELIETMSDAVLVVDGRGQIVDTNPAARAILGAGSSAVTGRQLGDVCPSLADVVETPIADENETVRTELSLVDDDMRRYYDVRVSVLTRGYGLVTGKLISLRDISEQRQHEQRLNVLNRLLRHDIRTELNVIKGHTSLLADELAESPLREHTARVDTAVTTIIERSEKFARVVKQLDVDRSEPVDLAADVATLVETTRRTHPDVRIAFTSDEEAWTTAGPFITTALEELVTNAIEHADRPDLEISIGVTVEQEDDRDVVRVRVADNGPGIPEAELEPIVQGTETQLTHSTGVGLWLVTWIVQETGGSIEITGGDDGSRVVITLPRASDRERDAAMVD
ncbi:histidine kinase N-terminal 7TM domain-containing protein [Natrinema salaciae]|uniref:PAS domain S-box-containing protein n=1 Tax=Natrinema salaciae TaxID=1186196 RepID=A0A1H9K3P2_9EURY|nr:histidine kinase N-terminal 7TM domain-containing protein [Natrinema salaciae]SEQ93553.1 PAS domain S-box-containing protein [Natrinema salaciae]